MIKLTSLQDNVIFILPDSIELIEELPEDCIFPKRSLILTKRNKEIVVKETATFIISLIRKDFKKSEPEYSKILQRFSEYLENPKVLTNPQEFLGLHYKKVLVFWNKIENLTQEQLEVVKKRHKTFFDENRSEWDKAKDLAIEAAKEVVGDDYVYHVGWAAWENVRNSWAAGCASLELIGGVENPTFLKMFDNL
jgi:hypothetical protein